MTRRSTGSIVTSSVGQWRRSGGVPLTVYRAVFVARDWGGTLVVRSRGEYRLVTVDVYALAALDAAFGVA